MINIGLVHYGFDSIAVCHQYARGDYLYMSKPIGSNRNTFWKFCYIYNIERTS